MPKGISSIRIIAAILMGMLLVAVRAFETTLFYDPFLEYFRGAFQSVPLPDLNYTVCAHLVYRYTMNSMISLAIIHLVFWRVKITEFAAWLYLILLIALIGALLTAANYFPEQKMTVFYIRRFLIQPMLLFLFLPAFYFQLKASKS